MNQRLRWDDAEGALHPAESPGTVHALDSWLAADGTVRGLPLHIRRFAAACQALGGPPQPQVATFFRAAAARVPTTGTWFPRVELAATEGELALHLWIRPAPTLGESVRLWAADGPDRRTRPDVKGVDLDRLGALRDRALAAGADEALLLDGAGRIVEGSTTSLLWWRGDTLCTPPATPRRLASVTRELLLGIAAAQGVRIAYETPTPRELDGLEVWAVNALHGIRPVTQWTNLQVSAGPAVRAPRWRGHLGRLAQPAPSALSTRTSDHARHAR
ncbi:aminotransferase class IV [Streptomyces inhibens]|uniref:aminotransferase class IV n=1 Tax=Streptomyces inhibens TaxID=2293571 RepID=UPI00379CECD9